VRQNIDGHWYKRRFDNAIRNLKANTDVSEANKRTILRFLRDLESENVGIPRLTKYLFTMPVIGEKLGKNFNDATREDIKRIVSEINQSTKYSDWTKSDFKIALKRFYRWLRESPKGETPREVAWITISNGKGQILPEELLCEDDVTRLAAAAENSRDRAFVWALYESDARIGELLNLRRKHVTFDQYGAILMLAGKTGDRRVRIILSSPALADWMNDHPNNDNPESPLWCVIGDRNHAKPLMYESARLILKRLAKRSGIKKRVNPHMFRHSRSTILANTLTEPQLKQFAGWTASSKMPGRYVHLSGRDVDTALLRMHGIKNEEEKQTVLTVKTCPRCSQKNDPLVRFCAKCGLALNVEAAIEVDESRKEADSWLNLLLKDPEVRDVLLTKLRQIMETLQKPSIGPPAQPLTELDVQAPRERESIRVTAKRFQS
jgi:integrase/recombinase XerD